MKIAVYVVKQPGGKVDISTMKEGLARMIYGNDVMTFSQMNEAIDLGLK